MGDDSAAFQVFYDSLVKGICAGLNVPPLVIHDTNRHVDKFDAMTDFGYKLNLIMGRYEKDQKTRHIQTIQSDAVSYPHGY